MARDNGEFGVGDLFKIVGLIAGIFTFIFAHNRSKKAEAELEQQYLVNPALFTKSPKKIKEEIAKQEWWIVGFFWNLFGGLHPLLAALLSTFILDNLILTIIVWAASTVLQFLFGFTGANIQGAVLTVYNFINLFAWLFFLFFFYSKFNKYKSELRGKPVNEITNDDLLARLKEADEEFAYPFDTDVTKELILGRKTTVPHTARKTHMYVIGMTGMGKSSAAENWFIQDFVCERGCAIIDPHGDLVDHTLSTIAGNLYSEDIEVNKRTDLTRKEIEERLINHPALKRIILIDLSDPEHFIGFNPVEPMPGVDSFRQARQLADSFKKVWNFDENEAPVMSQVLRNISYVLIEKKRTLLDATRLLHDDSFRREMVKDLPNAQIRSFWQVQYEQWKKEKQLHRTESAVNKLDEFISDSVIRLIIGQKKSTINLRESIDRGDVLLVKLPKGKLGSAANLIGAFFIANLHLAAQTRADIPKEEDRRPFYVYIDEFQNYASSNFDEILSEDRKYGIHYILINQYLDNLDEEVRSAIFGNVNIMVSFRIGAEKDAEAIASRMFHVSGKLIQSIEKEPHMIPGTFLAHTKSKVSYYSVSEEERLRAEEFRKLPPRTFAVHYTGLSKPLLDITIPMHRYKGKMPEHLHQEYLSVLKEIINRRNTSTREEVEKRLREAEEKDTNKSDYLKKFDQHEKTSSAPSKTHTS